MRCKKYTKNINPRVSNTSSGKNKLYYQNVQRAVVKHQEARGLFSNIGLRTPLSKIPLLGDAFFLEL